MQLQALATTPTYSPAVIALPCAIEARYLARQILREGIASEADIELAIETLEQSNDWADINLARMMREQRRKNAMILREEAARARREDAIIDLTRPIIEDRDRAERRLRVMTAALAICLGALLMTMCGAAMITSITATKAQAVEWRASL